MKKADADKARKMLLGKIKRQLFKGAPVSGIAEASGYTTARIYQIRAAMIRDGVIKPTARAKHR